MLFGFELKRRAVDAIAQPIGSRTIRENMAEMSFANGAAHLGSDHAMRDVPVFCNHFAVGWRGKAWPARAAVELGGGRKNGGAASGAAKFAFALFVPLLFMVQLGTIGAAIVAALAPLYLCVRRRNLTAAE